MIPGMNNEPSGGEVPAPPVPDEGGPSLIDLRTVTKVNLAFVWVFFLASLVFRETRVTVGVLLGGAVVAVNFWWLRRLVERALAHGGRYRTVAIVMLMVKFAVLLVVVALIVMYFDVNVVAFVVGTTTIYLAIVTVALINYFRSSPAP